MEYVGKRAAEARQHRLLQDAGAAFEPAAAVRPVHDNRPDPRIDHPQITGLSGSTAMAATPAQQYLPNEASAKGAFAGASYVLDRTLPTSLRSIPPPPVARATSVYTTDPTDPATASVAAPTRHGAWPKNGGT